MARDYLRFRVVSSESGQTLRALLVRRVPDTDRARATAMIKAGGVYVDNVRVRLPSVRVAEGERLTVYPEAAQAEALARAALRIVARGPGYVVLDKPAGVPVTATRVAVRGSLSQALVVQLRREGVARPYVGVVHGLPRGAAGLVLFTARGHDSRSVHAEFRDAPCVRRVRVRVRGEAPESLTCDAPLAIHGERVTLASAGDDATPAVTAFRRIAVCSEARGCESILEVELSREPIAQVIVHAEARGFPILGAPPELPSAAAGRSPTSPYRDLDHGPDSDLALVVEALEFTPPGAGAPVQVAIDRPPWAVAPDAS